MQRSLRIALVVNPFTLRLKGRDHAPCISRELLGRGHTVRGFGAKPGVIPRSGDVADALGLIGFQPDVIVVYDALSPAAWQSARRARRLGIPLVAVEEGFPASGRWLERALRWIGEQLWGRYVRKTVDQVIALDPVARAQVLDKGFPAERVRTLPAGVDLAQYRPGLHSPLPSRHGVRGRVVLHVGPQESGRGIETLLRAFADTVGRREDWSLLLAGDGALRSSLRVLTNRLGVASQVHWIGRPREEELPGLLGASTLYVAPCLDDKTTGRMVARALACGVPVIASDVPRQAVLVDDDETGLLVPPGDLGAWRAALQAAASAPRRRERWATQARELARERYDWRVVAARLEELLFAACDRHERRADGAAAREVPAAELE